VQTTGEAIGLAGEPWFKNSSQVRRQLKPRNYDSKCAARERERKGLTKVNGAGPDLVGFSGCMGGRGTVGAKISKDEEPGGGRRGEGRRAGA